MSETIVIFIFVLPIGIILWSFALSMLKDFWSDD